MKLILGTHEIVCVSLVVWYHQFDVGRQVGYVEDPTKLNKGHARQKPFQSRVGET